MSISIILRVDPGSSAQAFIFIEESNFPVLPPDPKLNPQYKPTVIGGEKVVVTETDVGLGPGLAFYFSRNQVWFVVRVYNLPSADALKVVESMME